MLPPLAHRSRVALATTTVLFGSALADPPRLNTYIRVLEQRGSSVIEQKFSYKSGVPKQSLRLISPHPYKNPKHLTNTWTGYSLKDVLRHQLNEGRNQDVVVSGASGYNVFLSENIIRKHSILVATQKDGAQVQLPDGGQQLVYPLGDPTLPEELTHDSWWVWFVTAIFVGEFKPRIKIDSRPVNISKETGLTRLHAMPCYPQGARKEPPPKQALDIGFIEIQTLMQKRREQSAKIVRIESYLGKSLDVPIDSSEYGLAVAWDGKPIPVTFGGPVQLYRKDKPTECLFLIEKIVTLQ